MLSFWWKQNSAWMGLNKLQEPVLKLWRYSRNTDWQLFHHYPNLLFSSLENILCMWHLASSDIKQKLMKNLIFQKKNLVIVVLVEFFHFGANFRQYSSYVFLKPEKLSGSTVYCMLKEHLGAEPLSTTASCSGILNIYSLIDVLTMHVQTWISHYAQNLLSQTLMYSLSLCTTFLPITLHNTRAGLFGFLFQISTFWFYQTF